MSLRTALDAYTAGAARVTHCADRTGTIEVGKDADLIVLDADITTADDIGELSVQTTMAGGEIVFARQ
ncbi:MAG TPA: amidohydrolase family protein [Gordonia sp. (in: high G+C Gram-positive bacteria)]|nr:amidohydrolase family protein [Gordonia sp. (in: high G+C Gram-positive bacteria)]